MTEPRQPIVRPPENKGGNLWAVLVGVAVVAVIVGLLAWWQWPGGGGTMATSPDVGGQAPATAPAGTAVGTDAPAAGTQ